MPFFPEAFWHLKNVTKTNIKICHFCKKKSKGVELYVYLIQRTRASAALLVSGKTRAAWIQIWMEKGEYAWGGKTHPAFHVVHSPECVQQERELDLIVHDCSLGNRLASEVVRSVRGPWSAYHRSYCAKYRVAIWMAMNVIWIWKMIDDMKDCTPACIVP